MANIDLILEICNALVQFGTLCVSIVSIALQVYQLRKDQKEGKISQTSSEDDTKGLYEDNSEGKAKVT